MNRVVVTGMGIVSSLGTNCAEVLSSLKTTKSGIKFDEIQAAMGLRSHVSGAIAEIDSDEIIDRKMKRFMADAAIYNAVALDEAIKQSGLTDAQVSNPRTGLIMGSGGASNQNVVEAADILREKSIKRVGPYRVPRTMGSTTSPEPIISPVRGLETCASVNSDCLIASSNATAL
jgi:3-oxoacyl-[acyl-carrier-protein] synthase-1